jgi:hypothetical protein
VCETPAPHGRYDLGGFTGARATDEESTPMADRAQHTSLLLTAVAALAAMIGTLAVTVPSTRIADAQGRICTPTPPPGFRTPAEPPLLLSVGTDRPEYSPGASVRFTLTVSNPAAESVVVYTNLIEDFRVTDTAGVEVWRLRYGPVPIPTPLYCTFAANATVTFAATWDQRAQSGAPVPPGVYAVTGALFAVPGHTSTPAMFTISHSLPSCPPQCSIPGRALIEPGGTVTFAQALPPAGPGEPPSPAGPAILQVRSEADQSAVLVYERGILLIAVQPGFAVRVPQTHVGIHDCRHPRADQPDVLRCLAPGRPPAMLVFTTTYADLSDVPSPCPPSCPLPAQVTLPAGGFVSFAARPSALPPDSPPRGLPSPFSVISYSDQPASVSAAIGGVTITTPPGSTVQVVGAGRSCATAEQPNVVRCGVGPVERPAFTTVGSRLGEATLDLRDRRPCIPGPGQRDCSAVRTALWDGEAGAWAARGVTDSDARFNETVVFRVQAGDPAAISNVARLLIAPYLQILRLRFAGVEPGQVDEFVEVRNLGGAPQEMTGWTLRSPATGRIFRFPDGFVLSPLGGGGSCRVYTGVVRVDSCGGSFDATDVWPDQTGEALLDYEALALSGDAKRYGADLNDQPPPPNLQSALRAMSP